MQTPLCPVCSEPVICHYRSVEDGNKLVMEELECQHGHYKLSFVQGAIDEWKCAECQLRYRAEDDAREETVQRALEGR